MKCSQCGHEMPDGVKFCKMCGTPAVSDLTMLADGESVVADRGDQKPGVRNDDRTRYRDARYDDDFDDANRSENAPRHRRYADERSSKSEKNRKGKKNIGKKPLIISIVALVLVIAIVLSIILIVNRNTVSAAELNEAKEMYLPPAQAITIDTSLTDPSNDKIKFTYDDRARITSCTYKANERAYSQSYTYDDSARNVNIVTSYRKHPIFTKDIGYDKVNTANTFESVEGYYLRLDDKCVGKSDPSSSVVSTPQPTAAPETEAPAEEPTDPPTAVPTDYREMYIAFLSQTDLSYDYGTLIYLNDDETPELLLFLAEETNYWPGCKDTDCKEAYLCWINNGEIKSDTVYCDGNKKTGNWDGNHHTDTNASIARTGNIRATMVYGAHGSDSVMFFFDGSSLSRIHNISTTPGKDTDNGQPKYVVDGEVLSEDDYVSNYGQEGWEGIKKSASKNDLPDYIRNYQ